MSARKECYTKKRYRTKEYAMKVKRKREESTHKKLGVYFCTRCAGWHLTSNPNPEPIV